MLTSRNIVPLLVCLFVFFFLFMVNNLLLLLLYKKHISLMHFHRYWILKHPTHASIQRGAFVFIHPKAFCFSDMELHIPTPLAIFSISIILLTCFPTPSCSSSPLSSNLHPLVADSALEHLNHTAISEFRLLNRRRILECRDPNPYLQINVSSAQAIGDEEFLTVSVTGVLVPADSDWVAMISPSNADVSDCPLNKALYVETGDLSDLPLLCHYPVKAQYLSKDPDYLSCKKKECKKYDKGKCVVTTCGGTLKFHIVNIRTDIEFVLFAGGFATPCILRRSNTLTFVNPKQPLNGHLSSIDSTGTSMRITWVSGDKGPQKVQYGNGKTETSQVSTFSQDDMCSNALPSPAKDFGWHDPGYIHSAVMTGLRPSTSYSYKYGSDSAGWSKQVQFRTPPAGGSKELKFLAFGDMGKAPLDDSVEHYIQPGSVSVAKALLDDVVSGNVDAIFHIGDISYATGFLVEWDFFLHLISPFASRISYMTAIGNHERDYGGSGSVYVTPDSGGECGIAYETYFPMPTPAKDKPWYSIEQASVHFTVISTEHDWSENSEQYQWMKRDMASVDRSKTPWLVFMGHRPMYTSGVTGGADQSFLDAVEPLLLDNKVDLALFGHVHNYERTCSVYQSQCKAMPKKDQSGVDTYDHSNYSAPVQAVIGMAGFSLDDFKNEPSDWSLIRISKFGHFRGHATPEELQLEYVNANTRKVEDIFRITR